MKKQLTPQEKKELSYNHDRRNNYGENHKSSTKSIHKRKRLAAKAVRRLMKAKQLIGGCPIDLGATGIPEVNTPDRLNAKERSQVKGASWKKSADVSLLEHLAIRKKAPKFRSIKRFFDKRVLLRKSGTYIKFADYK